MTPQTRLERFEHRTEWPLAAAAQIEELRDEIRKLTDAMHRSTPGDPTPAYGEARPGAEQRSLEGGT